MGLTFLIIAICIIFGGVAALSARGPIVLPDFKAAIKGADVKRFSPKKTLFVIGPSVNAHACKIQRRLLKPAIAALIRDDVKVIEVYGDDRPRENGAPMEWLDASLLRHAMNAEEGFFVIYVDIDGQTIFRSEAPMLARDIIKRARLNVEPAPSAHPAKKSLLLKKLRAA
jgi:hypothetical protein